MAVNGDERGATVGRRPLMMVTLNGERAEIVITANPMTLTEGDDGRDYRGNGDGRVDRRSYGRR